jgi:hypothetical protein
MSATSHRIDTMRVSGGENALFSGQDIENATYFSLEASNRSVAS